MLMLVLFFTGLSNVSVIITAEILTVIHFSVFFITKGSFLLWNIIVFMRGFFSCIFRVLLLLFIVVCYLFNHHSHHRLLNIDIDLIVSFIMAAE